MFGILAKFFRFSGRENGNKFKLSIVIGLIEALASAMKIPAIMYILIGLLSGKTTGKYIGGSVAIMVLAIVVDVICKRYSTVLQTEGGYNASAFMRIKIAEHLRYLPMGYFNSNSIGEISSITTNTMEILGDVAARVVMLTMQGILETSMIILMLFIFDWRIGLIAAAGVLIFFGVNSVMQNAGKKDSEQKVVCDTELVNQIMEYLQGISEVKSYNLLGKQAKRLNDANEACEKVNTKMEMLFVPYHFLQSVITKITGAVIVAGSATLSGGEKQRISIARAIMKDAPIVILDEATANVDPENEKELMDAVDALTKEKTIIMIAHRLKTVRHADQIVVVDKGKIVQQGTHEQLMKQEGIYKRFVDARQQAVSWKLVY